MSNPNKVLEQKSADIFKASQIVNQNSLQKNSSVLAPLAVDNLTKFTPVTSPTLKIINPVSGSQFFINTVPQMPQIIFEVEFLGFELPNQSTALDPTFTKLFDLISQKPFELDVNVTFNAERSSSYGKAGVVFSDVFNIQTEGFIKREQFVVTFPWFRGGDLTVNIKTKFKNILLQAEFRGKIVGTNPDWQQVSEALGDDLLRKIAKHESKGRQFEVDIDASKGIVPVFNRGRDGEAGIMQITPPTSEDIWNWQTNIATGKRIFAEKQSAARNYPRAVANSSRFKTLVKKFNESRKQQGQPALTISVPDFNPEQLKRDTLRGYNGYAGIDGFGQRLHEYRVIEKDDMLQIKINESSLTGEAVWEQVPVTERPQVGNPNYVDDVLNTKI
jgi:hypothetical protein